MSEETYSMDELESDAPQMQIVKVSLKDLFTRFGNLLDRDDVQRRSLGTLNGKLLNHLIMQICSDVRDVSNHMGWDIVNDREQPGYKLPDEHSVGYETKILDVEP